MSWKTKYILVIGIIALMVFNLICNIAWLSRKENPPKAKYLKSPTFDEIHARRLLIYDNDGNDRIELSGYGPGGNLPYITICDPGAENDPRIHIFSDGKEEYAGIIIKSPSNKERISLTTMPEVDPDEFHTSPSISLEGPYCKQKTVIRSDCIFHHPLDMTNDPKSATFDKIRARQLSICDDQGNTRILLSGPSDTEKTSIEIYDWGFKPRLQIFSSGEKETAGIYIQSPSNKESIYLVTWPNQQTDKIDSFPGITITGPHEKQTTLITSTGIFPNTTK